MEVWVAKLVSLALLLSTTLLFGLVPIQLIKLFRSSKASLGGPSRPRLEFILSLLNCFAGGVFLGTTLLHLIPDVREDVQDLLTEWNITTNFAVAEFIISIGFFIILLIETLVMVLQHHNNAIPIESVESSICSNKAHDCRTQRQVAENTEQVAFSSHERGTRKGYGSMRTCSDSDGGPSSTQEVSEGNRPTGDERLGPDEDSHYSEHQYQGCHHRLHHHHKHHPVTTDPVQESASQAQCGHPPVVVEAGDCVHVIHPSHHQHHHLEASQLGSLRSFVLLLALSLHTVFEGLAIGLQSTESSVWNLFIAIVVHKCIIAFSIGIQFAENLRTYSRAVLFVLFFALMSPIGIGIGTALTTINGGNAVLRATSAVLEAIATGTFLHVTFFEVLQKEIAQDHNIIKVLFVLLGYGAMVLLNLFNADPHKGG